MNNWSGNYLALHTTFEIAKETFFAVLGSSKTGMFILAGWKNDKNHEFDIEKIAANFSVKLPDFLKFKLLIQQVDLVYTPFNSGISLDIQMKEYGFFKLSRTAVNQKSTYSLDFELKNSLMLDHLPIIGEYMNAEDFISFRKIKGDYTPGFRSALEFFIDFQLRGQNWNPVLSIGGDTDVPLKSEVAERETDSAAIKWISIQKDVKILHFHRLGFSFSKGKVILYLDCGITISILNLEFINLYMALPISLPIKPEFGLKGLAVSLHKSPLSITGGLYLDKESKLYNGQVTVQFNQLSLLAMGSYGELPGTKKPSFFLYLMLGYPLGGPPCFFITGISAGFGINRKVIVPQLKEIENFPLVAAVLGKNPKLAKETDASKALQEMSHHIVPAEDQYFICAGIRFTTFGMLDSFALLCIQFGGRFEIDLLGVSQVSLPPAKAGVTPIAYAKLNLRAVFCPADGILQMEAALSNDSYLLTKDCKLTGGFAFYSWFKGEHAGDFVLSLGGYHPTFHRDHYPKVDRIGINWKIDEHLHMHGDAYFALTPSCLMAGGSLEIVYQIGKLRAWCRALANILLVFKPFYYDIEISVSIGVSYRLDIWFIHKTFSIELGADLRLQGPEFTGKLHVKWFIISFTIHFGPGSGKKPAPLGWDEFRDSFLLDNGNQVKTLGAEKDQQEKKQDLWQFQITNGLLTKESAQKNLVNGKDLCMEVSGKLPGTDIYFNGDRKNHYEGKIGIVPMEQKEFCTSLKVNVYPKGKKQEKTLLQTEILYQNVPSALWAVSSPGMNGGLIGNVPVGISMKPKAVLNQMLPAQDEWYDVKRLTKNQELLSPYGYCWSQAKAPAAVDYSGVLPVQIMEETMEHNSVRSKWLKQMSSYDIYEEEKIRVSIYILHLPVILWAPPVLQTTAAAEVKKIRNQKERVLWQKN